MRRGWSRVALLAPEPLCLDSCQLIAVCHREAGTHLAWQSEEKISRSEATLENDL